MHIFLPGHIYLSDEAIKLVSSEISKEVPQVPHFVNFEQS